MSVQLIVYENPLVLRSDSHRCFYMPWKNSLLSVFRQDNEQLFSPSQRQITELGKAFHVECTQTRFSLFARGASAWYRLSFPMPECWSIHPWISDGHPPGLNTLQHDSGRRSLWPAVRIPSDHRSLDSAMTMTKHVALLRGINVGGKASVPMKELSLVCGRLGWKNVITYLCTGNVVLDAFLEVAQLEESLENTIMKEFGLTIPVIVKSRKKFSAYLSDLPFSLETENDPSHVVIYFSKSTPATSVVEVLRSKAFAGESFIQQGDAIWIYYPKGIGDSKITPAVIDRSIIGSPTTGRKGNTLMKIKGLCHSA